MPPGSSLADHLFSRGIEFPCGGRGRCRGCRIRLIEGKLEETPSDELLLTPQERQDGWRMACQAKPAGDISIELRQWSALILADDTPFKFEPQTGYGIAVDLGTTTIAAQLLDLSNARVLGTETALNPQGTFGADVMSRIAAAASPEAAARMGDSVRREIAGMVSRLCHHLPAGGRVVRGAIVGNTAMHHLFLGFSVSALASYPFQAGHLEGVELRGSGIGWEGPAADAAAWFLPNLGGFVGSDILAVIIATGLHGAVTPAGGADLGTNGELIVASEGTILVASTAAGPAFEGARISQGMRAAPGAIDRMSVEDGKVHAHVVGGGAPHGICGSGLVDAIACGLDLGIIEPSGRLTAGEMRLRGDVRLVQQDIREVQLAKGAIAAGLTILAREKGLKEEDLGVFHLAGAFGNHLDIGNSRRIGLLPLPAGRVNPAGNAALLGAKMTLCMPDGGKTLSGDIISRVRHISLETSADFQDLYAERMTFPEKGEIEK
jgi:uncharacterized 2Fe-2S/4Fe-4S cluster protein (DUF4445 family)